MSEKVDAILSSGCLEKLLEDGAPTIADEAAMATYLGENGFSDVSDLDLALIKGEMAKLIEAEAALDEAGAGVKGKAKACGVDYCDLRVKEAIAPLNESEVKNELSEIAFFVKLLKS